MSKRIRPPRHGVEAVVGHSPTATMELTEEIASQAQATMDVRTQLEQLAETIESVKAPLDDLYDQRLALWLVGRQEGMTLKALAAASRCSDALVAQTLKRVQEGKAS